MRCVLEAAVEGGEAPNALKLSKQIERCAKLIRIYTASSEPSSQLCRQLCCLCEVQAFCGAHGWPKIGRTSLMQWLFNDLYEMDLVFENA